jgi:hypothetical protein
VLHALLVAGGPLGCACPHWRRIGLLTPTRATADGAPERGSPRLRLASSSQGGDRGRAQRPGSFTAEGDRRAS